MSFKIACNFSTQTIIRQKKFFAKESRKENIIHFGFGQNSEVFFEYILY